MNFLYPEVNELIHSVLKWEFTKETNVVELNKKLIFFMAAVVPAFASAETNTEILCFTSGGKPPVNLEMRLYYDANTKWQGGFIKYEKSKDFLYIVPQSTQATAVGSESPNDVTSTWIEISNQKITGAYELTSQGAAISSMVYKRISNKKDYHFSLESNVDYSVEYGCKWVNR